jgi:hypothetical protein
MKQRADHTGFVKIVSRAGNLIFLAKKFVKFVSKKHIINKAGFYNGMHTHS